MHSLKEDVFSDHPSVGSSPRNAAKFDQFGGFDSPTLP